MAGAAFIPVNGEIMDLADVKVAGYDPYDIDQDEGGAFGEVNAQVLTDRGVTTESYFWNDFVETLDDDSKKTWYGWYADGEEDPISETTCPIAAGEGLMIKCESYDYDYTFVWPKVDIK